MQSVGLKVQVDGEAEFKRSLNEARTSAKRFGAELRRVTEEFRNNADSEEAFEVQSDALNKAISSQEDYIRLLKEQLEQVREQYGENSQQANSLETTIANQETTLARYNNTLEESQDALLNASDGMDDVGDSAEDAQGHVLSFGDIIKANVISDVIVGGVKALADGFRDLAKATMSAFQDSVDWADDLATLSVQTGISTDTLQAFQYMEGLADVSTETITGSLRKLIRNMDNAADGTGDAADAFKSLGVNIKNDDGTLKDSYSVFLDVVDALGQLDDQTQRDIVAMDIFGRSAQELNTLVAIGSEGINDYAQEARDMGYILGSDVIGKLTTMRDTQDRLNNAIDTIKREGAAALAPFVDALANEVLPIVRDFAEQLNALFNGDISFGDFVSNVASGIMEHTGDFQAAAESIINALIEGFANAPNIINAAGELIGNLTDGLKEGAGENGRKLGEGVGATLTALANNFAELAGPVAELAIQFTTEFAIAVAKNLPEILIKTLVGVFTGAGGAISGFLKGIGADLHLSGEFADAIALEEGIDLEEYRQIGKNAAASIGDGIKADSSAEDAAMQTGEAIEESVTAVTDGADEWGADIDKGIAKGLRDNRWRIRAEIDAITGDIYRPLHFSRPDEGLLRNYDKWMPDMLKGMAKSLRDNAYLIEDAVRGVTGAVSGMMDIGTTGIRPGNNVTVYTQELTESQIEYLINRVNSGIVGI